jgi:hypothetical protein
MKQAAGPFRSNGSAYHPSGDQAKKPILLKKPRRFSEFCREFEPPSELLGDVIRSGCIYSLCGPTGSGKTGFLCLLAMAVATGDKDILRREVTQGRVAYFTFENPDDVRMRMIATSHQVGLDWATLDGLIDIFDERIDPESIVGSVKAEAVKSGRYALVIIDTLQAAFDGSNSNSAEEFGEFIRRLRPITAKPDRTAIVIATHPVKNAREDQLVPYGSGALLNELDGNLTIWRTASSVALHWQGKIRGVNFPPLPFRLIETQTPGLHSAIGKQLVIPVFAPSTIEAVEQRRADEDNLDEALLRAILSNPKGSVEDWGNAIGRKSSSTSARLQKLQGDRLIEKLGARWHLTPKGRRAAEAE